MKFTKEDNIITAYEARNIAIDQIDDSMVREELRGWMREIRKMASYGYSSASRTMLPKMLDEVKKELTLLKYSIGENKVSQNITLPHVRWDYVISWNKRVK